MKAIRIHEFGGPEVLKLEEIERPVPASYHRHFITREKLAHQVLDVLLLNENCRITRILIFAFHRLTN